MPSHQVEQKMKHRETNVETPREAPAGACGIRAAVRPRKGFAAAPVPPPCPGAPGRRRGADPDPRRRSPPLPVPSLPEPPSRGHAWIPTPHPPPAPPVCAYTSASGRNAPYLHPSPLGGVRGDYFTPLLLRSQLPSPSPSEGRGVGEGGGGVSYASGIPWKWG